MNSISRLGGTRDLFEGPCTRLGETQRSLGSFLRLHGYRLLDTPVLEPAELFLRKSGGELAARMYGFTDPGGHSVSLRPEFTSSVIRAYLKGETPATMPLRLQYAGPVFRYDPSSPRYRQFTQLGAELLGAPPPWADAEVMSLACQAAGRVGLRGARLAVGHVGVASRLLDGFGLSERARTFVVSHLGALGRGAETREGLLDRARRTGLLGVAGGGPQPAPDEALGEVLLHDAAGAALGSRTGEEVVERFRRKMAGSDDPGLLERSVELAERLAHVRGEPGEALERARALVEERGLDPVPLGECAALFDALRCQELGGVEVVLDLSLVRGLAYYTGAVFEVEHDAAAGGALAAGAGGLPSLCGGGRYDGLVRALGGGRDVPALGFACSLEPLAEAAGVEPAAESGEEGGVLVAAAGAGAIPLAVRRAGQLRESGTIAETDVGGRSLEENRAYARERGLSSVIVVKADGAEREYRVSAEPGVAAPRGS